LAASTSSTPPPYKKSKVTVTVKDASGTLLNTRTRDVDFNDQGQPITVTDPNGNITTYTSTPLAGSPRLRPLATALLPATPTPPAAAPAAADLPT